MNYARVPVENFKVFIPLSAPAARPECKSLRVVYDSEEHDRLGVERYEDRSDGDQTDEDEIDTSGIDRTEHIPVFKTEEDAEKNDGELEAEHDPMIVRLSSTPLQRLRLVNLKNRLKKARNNNNRSVQRCCKCK